jgi:hypothetical protein
MMNSEVDPQNEASAQAQLNRRNFFRQAGMLSLGAAASGIVLANGTPARAESQSEQSEQSKDTVAEIFTAFLIAEDLATTFYYNGLVGAVIQDPNLAGPGGSATDVTSAGNVGNVNYVQAALTEEIEHANFFRMKLTGSAKGASKDPYQTFYFPAGTFDTLANFLGILNALENAFIGAYVTVIQEFTRKAAKARCGIFDWDEDRRYSAAEYELLAKIAGSILGIESEHRVLGRVIGNNNPANNLGYEQTDGLQSIYNGPASAVVALTPFLTPSTGPGFSLATALAKQSTVSLPVTGSYPTM